jgi:hypothetical protein
MARRPPMKIAPSPSETPEHDAVRERERSSEAVQAKMREERTGGAVPPPEPTSLEDDTNGKAKVDKPASDPKTKKSKTAPKASAEPKNMQAPAKAQATTPESDAPAPRVEQRISVGVPVSLATSKALKKAAIKLGTDTDYIKRALLPKARAAFLKRAGANNLKATSKSMKLLFEQRIDNGVALMPVKLVVDDEIEARVRGFIPDPLDVISVNRLVAAFVGAEFDILVSAL